MRHLFLFPLILLFSLASLQAQLADFGMALEETVEPAPASRILDYGDVFANEVRNYEGLSRRLQSLYEKHDFSAYIVAYSGIIGSSVSERARIFRDHWLEPGKDGLVIVCDTDLKRVGFGIARTLPPEPNQPSQSFKLQDHQLEAVISQLQNEIGGVEDESEFLHKLGNLLVAKIETNLENRNEPRRGLPVFILPVLVLVALAVALLTWLGSWLKIRNRPGGITNRRFPDIDVHKRLGADFGGGTVSEVSFRPPR